MLKRKAMNEDEKRREEILKSDSFIRVELIVPTIEVGQEKVEPYMAVETVHSNIMMKNTMYNALKNMADIYLEEYPEIKIAQHIFKTESINKGSKCYEETGAKTDLDKFVEEAQQKLLEIIEKEEKEKKDE